MEHHCAIIVSAPEGLAVGTPDNLTGEPWWLSCEFEVGPWHLPLVSYFLKHGNPGSSLSPSWTSRKYNLLNRKQNQPMWKITDIAEEIFDVGYCITSAPQPSWGQVRTFLLRSRELLIEAHITVVARQFVSELSSEDVTRIWGMEDVKLVMES